MDKSDFVDSAIKEPNTFVDYTRQFIEKCAMNHYYISPNETGKAHLNIENSLEEIGISF